MSYRAICVVGVAALSVASFTHAQDAPAAASVSAQPAEASASGQQNGIESLSVTVADVQGLVQVRADDSKPWVKAERGMVVTQDAEFRTGPRSAVQLTIPPDQTITLDRLGVVKVIQAVNDNGVIRTNLGMPYGRTQFKIESAGVEHDATIASPSNTLAVRGTEFVQEDTPPFTAVATSFTGTVERRDLKNRRTRFGGKGTGVAVIRGDRGTSAATALSDSIVDPSIAFARSTGEALLVETLLSSGGVVGFDDAAGIRVVRGGVPPTDAQLLPILPGKLNFVLRWDSDADLNLSAFSGALPEDIVYPQSPVNRSPTGGVTGFDHRGGPNGGIEVVYWPKKFPSGLYGLGVFHMSGGQTNATVDAYQNGQVLQITDFTNGLQDQIKFPIGPGGTRAITAPVNETLPGFGGGGGIPGAPDLPIPGAP